MSIIDQLYQTVYLVILNNDNFLLLYYRIIRGGNFLCDGPVDDRALIKVMETIEDRKFGNQKQVSSFFSFKIFRGY